MSDDQCAATTQTGFGVVRCQLPTEHPEHHTNQQYRWYGGHPEQPTPWCGDGSGLVGGPCVLDLGHAGDHQNGAPKNYGSTNLAGAKHDDLILDLFRRVEQLEQTSASGAATDDMFVDTNRAVQNLMKSVADHQRRLLGLEQAQVYGPSPQDLSVLQASIANHVNQALTDLGSGLDSRFTLLTEALRAGGRDVERRHREMEGLLNRVVAQILGELKPVPPVFCEALDNTGTLYCEEGPDHDGRHQSGNTSWPNPCKQPHPTLGVTCCTVKGHTTEHLAAYDTRYGRVRWVDGQEQYQDLGTVRDDGAQSERASGSPAAVRCPAQFREGQCLGYAGHEGECSALPDPREPQLEDPEECGNSPAPGSASPPCGRPAGHTGVCASGPQYSGEDEPGDPFEGDGHGDTSHSV